MEFNCPQCGKRLRAPDHLQNPLVRCRRCGTEFRPRGTTAAIETTLVDADSHAAFPDPAPRTTEPSPMVTTLPRSPAPGQSAAKGFGIAMVIIVLLLAKAPRLLKVVFPDRKPPEAPARIEQPDMQAIQELLEEARKNGQLQPVPRVDESPSEPPSPTPNDPFAEGTDASPEEPPAP